VDEISACDSALSRICGGGLYSKSNLLSSSTCTFGTSSPAVALEFDLSLFCFFKLPWRLPKIFVLSLFMKLPWLAIEPFKPNPTKPALLM